MPKRKVTSSESIIYKDKLSTEEKQRYEAKLSIVGGLDPYEDKLCWSHDVDILPSVTYPDIVNYLLFTPIPYSADDLKAYKSIEAYNQFVCGWIREKSGIVHGDHVIILAKVHHSQRMNATPLKAWIIATKEGTIVGAHCKCMAGLGEVCTHVAALLFSIEATVKIRDSKTVTQEKAYWLLPSEFKSITYKEVREINFVSAKTAKKRLDNLLDSTCSSSPITPLPVKKTRNVPVATNSDYMSFAEKLSKLKSKPAMLSLLEPYSDKYVPKSDTTDFPKVMTDLRNSKLIGSTYEEIVNVCSDVVITCSKQQAENVETNTKGQSNSKLWFRFRAGRITASKARAVCVTNKQNPSQSLIKTICYPEDYKFQSLPTKWGCDNEDTALDAFMIEIGPHHDNISIAESGFVISQSHPYIGASPDSVFSCDCCGSACVEVKCPYNVRDEELSSENCSYLESVNGRLQLKRDHQYYFQVQTQLGVTQMEMGYFVVWTEKSCHVETIMFDSDLWKRICNEGNKLFTTAILPELVGKFYTTLPSSVLKSVENISKVQKVVETNVSNTSESVENISKVQKVVEKNVSNTITSESDEKLYCLCGQVEHGDMICCDNSECPNEWFHYRCVNVEKAPKGKWYCPDCRKMPEFKRKRIVK